MNETIARLVSALEKQQASFTPSGDKNDSIYLPKKKAGHSKYPEYPKCLYFYYLRLEPEGTITIWKHFWSHTDRDDPTKRIPIEPRDLPGIIEERAIFARANPPSATNGVGVGFGDTWKYRSYIILFVDEDSWKFHEKGDAKDPVVFLVGDGKTPNHSFYDADDYIIKMDNPNPNITKKINCTSVAMINHMKDINEDDLKNQSEVYHFDLFFEVASSSPNTPTITVIIDPTGTNQGPPIDPPPFVDLLPLA